MTLQSRKAIADNPILLHSHRTTHLALSKLPLPKGIMQLIIQLQPNSPDQCVRLCSAVVTLDFNQQLSPDELHIGHRFIRSSNGEPHHGDKAPGHHCRATNHGYHERNGGANIPNGCAPVKTTAWGGCHGSLALVLNDVDQLSITKANPPSQSINRIPSIKVSWLHQPPQKYTSSKKKRINFKRNLTYRRRSPTLACNASSSASKNSTSKNSTKSNLVMPTSPLKMFSTISEPTGARAKGCVYVTAAQP